MSLKNEHAVDRFKSAWLHKSLDNYCLRLKESAFVPWKTFVSENKLAKRQERQSFEMLAKQMAMSTSALLPTCFSTWKAVYEEAKMERVQKQEEDKTLALIR